MKNPVVKNILPTSLRRATGRNGSKQYSYQHHALRNVHIHRTSLWGSSCVMHGYIYTKYWKTLINGQSFTNSMLRLFFTQINTGELGYDGPLYDGYSHMTGDMLGSSQMHIKYSSYVYDRFCI